MSNEIIKTTFDLSAPQQAIEVATILQKFVKEKKLTSNIQGKEYPMVEAWQFAGSQLGLFPLLIETKDISNEQEIKYIATVEIRKMATNEIIGRGIALCSNKEYSKKKFDEYAILSMAQTRATGKAFRNLLAWLMKAAGFEATPAEEMEYKNGDEPHEEQTFKPELKPENGKWKDAVEALSKGIVTIDKIEAKYYLTSANRELLLTASI